MCHRAVVTSMFAPMLAAQALLQVPTGHAQIAAAIAAAQPGDVIEVASGSYLPFACDKAVTIAAQPGASVSVVPTVAATTATTGFVVPPGGVARVTGLSFASPSPLQRQRVVVTSGRVTFENCRFEGANNGDAGLRVDGAAVWLRACRCSGQETAGPFWSGGNTLPCVGLLASNAIVAAIDCEFAGGGLLPDGFVGAGDGIRAINSALHLVRCIVDGGPSFSLGCFYPSGHGLHVINGAGTWLVDSTLRGASGPMCTGGSDALHNTGSVTVHLTRTVTLPGVGPMSSGAPIFGPAVADNALGLAASTVDPMLGSPYQIAYHGNANAALLLFLSDHLAPAVPVITIEPVWLAGPSPFIAAIVCDASGLATFSTTIPNQPALRYASLWLHAAEWPGALLHVSPPIGGVLR